MADAGAWRRKNDAIPGCDGSQKSVIVGILETHLNGVVVHIADRKFCFDPVYVHGLKLEIGHGACGILGQSLVNAQRNFTAGSHIAIQ